jgi:hypothetical protein
VTLEGAQTAAGVDVPQPHGAIPAAGESPPCVGEHVHRGDEAAVAGEGLHATAGLQVPSSQHLVPAAGQGPVAVRADGDGRDVVLMAFEDA